MHRTIVCRRCMRISVSSSRRSAQICRCCSHVSGDGEVNNLNEGTGRLYCTATATTDEPHQDILRVSRLQLPARPLASTYTRRLHNKPPRRSLNRQIPSIRTEQNKMAPAMSLVVRPFHIHQGTRYRARNLMRGRTSSRCSSSCRYRGYVWCSRRIAQK